jgi:hypothetical protein
MALVLLTVASIVFASGVPWKNMKVVVTGLKPSNPIRPLGFSVTVAGRCLQEC